MGEIHSIKDEIIDLKEVIIQNLRDECCRLKNFVAEMITKIVDLDSKCN